MGKIEKITTVESMTETVIQALNAAGIEIMLTQSKLTFRMDADHHGEKAEAAFALLAALPERAETLRQHLEKRNQTT